jgi:hypothetical protein
MENFRCDIKCIQFDLFLNFKKSPKHSRSKTRIVEQIETFRSDIKNSTDRRTDRQDNMESERQDDRQTDNLEKVKTQTGETADDRLTERQTDRKINGQDDRGM